MISRYTNPEMARIWSEEHKFTTWLVIELFACEAQAKKGRIPVKSLRTIKRKAKFSLRRIEAIEKVVNHDVIAFLTSVAEYVGPDSRYIHMGMTSSDILDTALSYQMKEALQILKNDLQSLVVTLTKMARKYKSTIMMGRSHGVHAEPITFGLKMALFLAEAKRNLSRIKQAEAVIGYGKISGAVGTYAHMDPWVETYVCRKMGLKPASVSNQVLQRDRHAEYLSMLAIIGGSLEKITTELRHLQRTEVYEVEEGFTKGQKGSSAMPHKRNPIMCERISGLARILRGNAMAAMENITLWHERDITHSSVERVIIPDSTILLDYMLKKTVAVLESLSVYPENMKRNIELSRGLVASQEVLLALVAKGFTREKAYEIVQKHAMEVWKSRTHLRDVLKKDPGVKHVLTNKDIDRCFDLSIHIKHAPAIIERVIRS